MTTFKKRHIKIIEGSNGAVDGELFVTKVGVMLTKKSSVSSSAQALFDKVNIDTNMSESQQHAEFNSRLTYLSFKEEKSSSENYHNKMIKELGHRSIYNDEVVTFLIAGCSVETMLEFIAHNESSVARLTSSKTKAQDEPLYRLRTKGFSNEFIELQREIINNHEKVKEMTRSKLNSSNPLESEVFNVMSLGCKAVSFTITMSVKDWHKTLIGRLSNHGVESEMIEILDDVTDILNIEYPDFFEDKETYYEMNNAKKYNT